MKAVAGVETYDADARHCHWDEMQSMRWLIVCLICFLKSSENSTSSGKSAKAISKSADETPLSKSSTSLPSGLHEEIPVEKIVVSRVQSSTFLCMNSWTAATISQFLVTGVSIVGNDDQKKKTNAGLVIAFYFQLSLISK